MEANAGTKPVSDQHAIDTGALQSWLELGVLGASLLALAWAMGFHRLVREQRSLVSAAACGSAADPFTAAASGR